MMHPWFAGMRDALATRIVRKVFLGYITIAVLVTAVQVALEYQRGVTDLNRRVQESVAAFTPILGEALWSIDRSQVKGVLAGMQRIHGVDGIELIEFPSTVVIRAGLLAQETPDQSKILRSLSIPIGRRMGSTERQLGMLTVAISKRSVVDPLLDQIRIIVVNSLLKSLALWIILLVILQRMLGQPLAALSRDMRGLSIHNLNQSLTTAMPKGTELALIEQAYAGMRRTLANEITLRQEEATRAERLGSERDQAHQVADAKMRFIAIMAHEIRTPLNAMLGLADLASQEAGDHPVVQHIRQLRSSGTFLRHLVDDVLDLAKLEEGRMVFESVPMRLTEMRASLMDLFTADAANRGVTLTATVVDPHPEGILCDCARLRQALMNLVGNALKFSTHAQAPAVTVRISWESEYAQITITDNGIGMDAATQANLFQPFVQADAKTARRFGGSGLGLYITSRLITGMGGTITVSSEVEVGSTFVVRVPSAACEMPAEVRDSQHADRLDGLTVVLVDDVALNRQIAGALLRKRGAVVTLFADGQAALDYFASQAQCDVLIIDVEMPDLDGPETTRRLRQIPHRREVPVVGWTAHGEIEGREPLLAAGMNEILGKPMDVDHMVEVLRRLTSRG